MADGCPWRLGFKLAAAVEAKPVTASEWSGAGGPDPWNNATRLNGASAKIFVRLLDSMDVAYSL